jgi:hypothetical protein
MLGKIYRVLKQDHLEAPWEYVYSYATKKEIEKLFTNLEPNMKTRYKVEEIYG